MDKFFHGLENRKTNWLLAFFGSFLLSTAGFGQVCGSAQIFTYNEFTGISTFTGATTLNGITGSVNGPLGAALSNGGPGVVLPGTGNYLGVEDGELMFYDAANGTVEQYNWVTGIGVFENIPTTLLPTKGVPTVLLNKEPHSGDLVRGNGTRYVAGNGTFIDVGDDDLVYLDADGSLSSYYNLFLTGTCPNGGQGYLLTDPTWTTFTGGPVGGQAPTKSNILAVEDGFIYTLGLAGDNNYHYYLYASGLYVGMSNPGFPTFTGGVLNGTTPRAAMTNTVPGVTFLGGGALELVFFDANTNATVTYNRNNLTLTWVGINATSLSDPLPADAFVYNHTSINDVLGPDFLGVGDVELLLLDATGHMEWYNFLTVNGPGVYEVDMSILRGPQGGALVKNANYIDAVDDGYMFIDQDGTLSWYNTVNNLVYHDANWRTFDGGPLNGQMPTKSNIIAGEDGGLYVFDADGSLNYYYICDGKPWPVDLWTYTSLTNGPLAGKDLSDAIQNLIPGVTFLGIAADELVFAVCQKPEVETTKRVIAVVPNANGNTHNVTYEVKISNAGPVQIDRLQIKDSVATQLGCAFVQVVPGSMLIAQWGLTTPLTPLVTLNPGFNGTTDINILSTTNTTAGLPTNWLYNTVSVWYTVEVDADCAGTCAPNPSTPFLLNQARGIGFQIGGTDGDTDLSDDGFYDAADFLPVAPQPPTPLLPGQAPFVENTLWPGNTLPAPYGTDDRNNPTPLIFPGVTTTKGLVGSMVDPANPNFALAEFEIMMTNTGTSDLTMITLTDNLLANLGCAYVGIATPPAIVAGSTTAMTNPTINAGFTGAGVNNIFNGTTGLLKPCQKVTVRFTVRINPNCGATLGNTAVGGATGNQYDAGPNPGSGPLAGGNLTTVPSVGPVTISGNSVPAAGAPAGPGGSLVINIPLISTIKRVISTAPAPCPPTGGAAGTMNVVLEMGIKNVGNVPLTNLGIDDDLVGLLGAAFVGIVGTPVVSGNATTLPTLNAGYAGTGNIFNGTTGLMAVNQEVRVQITVAINPNAGAAGMLMNQALGRGTGPGPLVTPVVVTDLSDTGTNFEDNNTGQVGDSGGANDKTILNLPQVGVSKRVVSSVDAPCATGLPRRQITTFELVMKNTGNMPLTNLQLLDNVATSLGCTYQAISTVPAVTSTGTAPTLNAAWNATANGNLFNGTTGNLAPNQTVTVTFSILMDPACTAVVPTNQATGSATGTNSAGVAVTVSDLSDAGLDPESNNPGQLGDTGCSNDPTPVQLPGLRVSKRIVSAAPAVCPTNTTAGQQHVVYEISMKNLGNVALSNLQLTDAMLTQMGCLYQGVAPGGAPFIFNSTAAVNPTLNAGFTGSGNNTFFNGTSGTLNQGQIVTIRFTAAIYPNCTAVVPTNQATGTAAALNFDNIGTTFTDLSDTGNDPETTNPGQLGDTGCSNDPTVNQLPQIGLAKRIISAIPAPCQPGLPGNQHVVYEFTVKNTGNSVLSALTLVDAMAAQLGCTYLGIAPGGAPFIFASTAFSNPTLNAGFNGSGVNGIFNGTTGSLAANQTITVRFTAVIDPNCAGAPAQLNNQATAGGDGLNFTNTTITVTDLSDTGPDAESNNIGQLADTGCNNDPTRNNLPGIGVAKRLVSSMPAPCPEYSQAGHMLAVYEITVKNTGNVPLSNLTLIDNMAPMGCTLQGVANGGAPTIFASTAAINPILNGSFNGTSATGIFNGASGTLNPNQTITVRFTLLMNPNCIGFPAPLLNQATAGGTGLGFANTNIVVTDLSDSGSDAESNNTVNSPGDTGCSNDATVINLPNIGVSKGVWNVVQAPCPPTTNLAGDVHAIFEVVVKNTGNVPLTNLTLVDNLAAQLGCTFKSVAVAPTIFASTAATNPTINAGFNGTGNNSIFNGTTGNLLPNQTITVRFTLLMDPNCAATPNPLPNQLTAGGSGAGANGVAVVVTDQSDSGFDPEANNPNRSGDSGCNNDITLVDLPVILATKLEVAVPGKVLGDNCPSSGINGHMDIAFKIRVFNAGNTVLRNIQVVDDLVAQLGSAFVKVIWKGFLPNSGNNAQILPTVNPGYNGAGNNNLFNGTTGQLLPNQHFDYVVAIEVNTGAAGAPVPFDNQALASALAVRQWGPFGNVFFPAVNGDVIVTDLSDHGLESETDHSAFAGDTGCSDDKSDFQLPLVAKLPEDLTISAGLNCADGFDINYEVSQYVMMHANAIVLPAAACGPIDWSSMAMMGLDWIAPATSGCGCTGTSWVNLDAKDQCNHTVCLRFKVTVIDETGPCFDMDAMDKTVVCDDPMAAASVNMWLNSGGGAWVYDCADGITTTHNYTGPVPPAAGTTTAVKFTFTDECGNSSSQTVNLTVTTGTSAPVLTGVPPNISISCELPMPNPANVTAATACQSNLPVSYTQVEQAGGTACKRVFIRTWSVTANGQTVTGSQSITVNDNTKPVLANIPADKTINCPNTPVFGVPTATDNCGSAVITFTDSPIGSCPAGYVVTRTWTATDLCGNTSTATGKITVLPPPPNPPVLTMGNCPPNQSLITPNPGGTTTTFSAPTATSTCTIGSVSVVQTSGPTSGSTFPIGTTTVCFLATDGCGNAATCCFSVVVTQGTPPPNTLTLIPPPNGMGTCSTPITFGTPTTSTTCAGGIVNLTFTDNSTGNSCTGMVRTRTWTATDNCGNLKTASQTLTIAPDLTPPVFTSLPPQDMMFNCGDVVNIGTATATDFCSSVTITNTVTANNGTGMCTVVNGITYGYDLFVVWKATDACGNAVTEQRNIWVLGNGMSFLSKPVDKTMHCGETIEWNQPMVKSLFGAISLVWSEDIVDLDACGAGTITRTWTAVDELGNTAQAQQIMTFMPDATPPVLNFNGPQTLAADCSTFNPASLEVPTASDNCASGSQVILKNDDLATASQFIRTWTATDACGNIVTGQQIVELTDLVAPVFTNLPVAEKLISCGNAVVFDAVEASDACNSFDLTFIDIVEKMKCQTTFSRIWTATDAKGNAATWTQTVVEKDETAPVASNLPTDKSISCLQTAVFDSPIFVDVCHPATLKVTFEDIATTPVCGQSGFEITRTWTANDGCGNLTEIDQTIAVEKDETAPVASILPADQSISCTENVVFDQPTFTDACNPATLNVQFDDVATSPTCGQTGFQITRTWTANDACGNVAEIHQTITVEEDKTAPEFTATTFAELELTQVEVQNWQPAAGLVTDDCSVPVISISTVNVTDACHFDLLLVATDACGNTAAATQPVHIIDGPCASSGTGEVEGQSVRIFPNPTSGLLFVEAVGTRLNGDETWQIQDIYGRNLLAGQLQNGKAQLDLTELASGTYLLKLADKTGNLTVKHLVKTN